MGNEMMNHIHDEKPIYDESALNDSDTTPWFGVQLYGLRPKEMADYLTGKDIESFFPMHDVDFIDREGKHRHELRPVVSNLIFIKKTMEDKLLQGMMEERYKGHFYIIRKTRGSSVFYQIPARQMQEFMIKPENTVMLGDKLSTDVLAARFAGIRASPLPCRRSAWPVPPGRNWGAPARDSRSPGLP